MKEGNRIKLIKNSIMSITVDVAFGQGISTFPQRCFDTKTPYAYVAILISADF